MIKSDVGCQSIQNSKNKIFDNNIQLHRSMLHIVLFGHQNLLHFGHQNLLCSRCEDFTTNNNYKLLKSMSAWIL